MSLASEETAINVSRDGDSLVITVTGDLDAHTAPCLGDVFVAASECQERSVVVDLSKVTFIDSSGLAVLVSGHRHLARAGGRLMAVDPSPTVSRLLDLTGLGATLSTVRRQRQRSPASPMFPRPRQSI